MRRLQAKFPFVWLVQSVLTKPHWLNNVEPSDCNSASHRTCRSATFRLHSINFPGTDMKKNEFRISEVPPGSVLLMGDSAGVSVAGGVCPHKGTSQEPKIQSAFKKGELDRTTEPCPQ